MAARSSVTPSPLALYGASLTLIIDVTDIFLLSYLGRSLQHPPAAPGTAAAPARRSRATARRRDRYACSAPGRFGELIHEYSQAAWCDRDFGTHRLRAYAVLLPSCQPGTRRMARSRAAAGWPARLACRRSSSMLRRRIRREIHRPLRVGERERLLLGQEVATSRGVVLHVATGRLTPQPLPDITRRGLGTSGELGGEQRAFAHGPVQPQLLAGQHVPGRPGSTEVHDEAMQELPQPALIHLVLLGGR